MQTARLSAIPHENLHALAQIYFCLHENKLFLCQASLPPPPTKTKTKTETRALRAARPKFGMKTIGVDDGYDGVNEEK
jgi:hypothetical protein